MGLGRDNGHALCGSCTRGSLCLGRPGRSNLFDVDDQFHLGVNGAQNIEIAAYGKGNVSSTAGLLIAGIKTEVVGLNIGVMAQIAVVIYDFNGFPALDCQLARMKLPPFLRHNVFLPGPSDAETKQPAHKEEDQCYRQNAAFVQFGKWHKKSMELTSRPLGTEGRRNGDGVRLRES